jgi:hypothetical protein
MAEPRTPATAFSWMDYSRFVEVAPVALGWLVLWGQYRDLGRLRELRGQQTYANLEGARRRVADAVLELTRNPAHVAEALALFDRTTFPEREPTTFPEPL